MLIMAPRGDAPLGLFVCPQRLERRTAALYQPAAFLVARCRARRRRRGTALAGRPHAHRTSRRLGRPHFAGISEALCF